MPFALIVTAVFSLSTNDLIPKYSKQRCPWRRCRCRRRCRRRCRTAAAVAVAARQRQIF